ncbi:MAG: IS4 family transposase [Rhodospirillaceae bacterium]|jgi:hypothetical protein|nr:IS4 family transposase [Rhodospirillaceae bacterium]
MQQSLTKSLSLSLDDHISLWRTRRETLVWLVTLIIQTGTVSLWRLAGHVDTRAKTLSVHRRFERFFQHVHLDEACVARLIVHIMGLSGKPWHLALDRTNWKFGRCHINILMLGVIHEKVCIPLFWVLLDKAGNSNARERTNLMGRLHEAFPDQPIASLSGDREFIGERWISWLESQGIPFVLRLKENMHVWNENHVPVKLSVHAARLRKRNSRILKGTWYLGRDPLKATTPIKIAMMRLKTGEMLIVAASRIRIKTALSTYRNRWGIETLFSALKTRGLGLEDTHMTSPHKLTTLMAVLAIAFCLAYKSGLWVARIKPPRHKSHGRLQRSLFALGLNAFRKAIVKMSELEIRRYVVALFKPNIPRNALIGLVL